MTTDVSVDVEEIRQDLTREEAQALTVTIRSGMDRVHGMLIDAYRGRAWIVLGYASWEAYCDGELQGARPKLPQTERREVVGEMRQAGMSQRAIGTALGVAPGTVNRDLSSVQNRTVDPEGDDDPSSPIVGVNGKTYQRPVTPPAPTDPFEGWTSEERRMRTTVEGGGTAVASLRGAHTRVIGWAEREGLYVRIDRRSQWGNPFEMPADGDRHTVIRNYEDHYLPHKPSLLAVVADLRGKILGCWCAPEPCHGDVLVRWANR